MQSLKGDQREFLAGGRENAVLKNVVWIHGLKRSVRGQESIAGKQDWCRSEWLTLNDLLCSRHYSKGFTCISLFQAHISQGGRYYEETGISQKVKHFSEAHTNGE